MLRRLLLSLPLAITWMPLTGTVSLESFGVGLLLSFAVLTLLFSGEPSDTVKAVTVKNIPQRVVASMVYFLILCRDIYLSAMDVSKRVIDPRMPLNPGIIAVSTQYESSAPPLEAERDLTADSIAAISAHGITITPGELVVDFDGNKVMYVHCLDVEASLKVADSNQAKRIGFLRRILL
jgi:multicomponent Na+:H+ antiporter subunit E